MKLRVDGQDEFEKFKRDECITEDCHAALRFAIRWARLMQQDIESTGRGVRRCAIECAIRAAEEPINGMAYAMAVGILSRFWKYGDELRSWHNRQFIEVDDARKVDRVGVVLNPLSGAGFSLSE